MRRSPRRPSLAALLDRCADCPDLQKIDRGRSSSPCRKTAPVPSPFLPFFPLDFYRILDSKVGSSDLLGRAVALQRLMLSKIRPPPLSTRFFGPPLFTSASQRLSKLDQNLFHGKGTCRGDSSEYLAIELGINPSLWLTGLGDRTRPTGENIRIMATSMGFNQLLS